MDRRRGAGRDGLGGGDPPAAVPPLPVTVVQVGGSSGDPGATRYSGAIKADESVDLAFRVSGMVDAITQVRGADGRLRAIQDGDPVRRGPGAGPAAADRVPRPGGRRRRHAAPGRGGLRARLAALREPLDQQGRVRRRLRPLHREPGPPEPGGDLPRRRDAPGAARRRAPAPLGGGRLARWAVGAGVQPRGHPGSEGGLRRARRGRRATQAGPAGSPIQAEALPGAALEGRITRISPSADPDSRVFEVEAALPNPQGRLKVGMLATLRLGREAEDAALVRAARRRGAAGGRLHRLRGLRGRGTRRPRGQGSAGCSSAR